MARELPISNGHLFVAFDNAASIRELTYPLVGKENHVGGRHCRVGFFADGIFSWIRQEHILSRSYEARSPVVNTRLRIPAFPDLLFTLTDWVDQNDDILYRHLRINNDGNSPSNVILFLHHDMDISHSDIGNTAAFLSREKALLHYKDDVYFLMSTLDGTVPGLFQYACGARHGHREGTWKDAEDGRLEGNPIAQGAVDSVYSVKIPVPEKGYAERTSLLVAGSSYGKVVDLFERARQSSSKISLSHSRNFFDFWIDTPSTNSERLPESYRQLLHHSLFILRNHMGANGSLVAAIDSDSLSLSRDTYSYLWPRDGAIIAHALDRAGYGDLTRRFYQLLPGLLSKEGFLLHKYHPSLSPGSSWHPSGVPGTPTYPIQEDETALCIWALERHLDQYRDLDSIYPLYRSFVLPAAHFLQSFRNETTGLPLPSYDLWEERPGIWTFTVATVWAGLGSAARMAKKFGDDLPASQFSRAQEEIGTALRTHLCGRDNVPFLRGLHLMKDGALKPDTVSDSSLSSLFWLNVLSPQDPILAPAMEHLFSQLTLAEPGGVVRYVGDPYYREDASHSGNPWIISTLWKVRWLIRTIPDPLQSQPVRTLLDWVVARSGTNGMLAEQYHPRSLAPLSASPLSWSHAEWVLTMIELADAGSERHPWDDPE
ncbi:MAG: glycoside hydrolase family 15 protein [Nitrospirota bacterium]|nr:glycoside hydrolase family 15 protein [Nitrospirota bacterium]